MSPQVVIVNPGTQPELQYMAAHLHRRGHLQSYISSFTVGHGYRPPMFVGALPGGYRERLRADIARRAIDVPEDLIRRCGQAWEAMFMALRRQGLMTGLQDRLLQARDHRVQRVAVADIDQGTAVVVGRSTSSVAVFTAAQRKNVRTLLDYPIAHHRVANHSLLQEAARFPRLRASLEPDLVSPGQAAHLEREIELADSILVFNDHHAQSFVDAGVDSAKLIRRPLGVNLPLFRSHGPVPRRDPSSRFTIVYVGQLTQRKGIAYAVDAFRRARIPNSELVLVGRSVGAALEAVAGPNIRHVPHVAREALPSIYRQAHAFLFPSLVEGFAQTPIEALAAGVPVITTPNAVGQDLLRSGVEGFLVSPRDVPRMAEILTMLHDDEDLRVSVAEAGRTVADRYGWEASGAGLAEGVVSTVF